jgi:selT/selW/selH-like putative selenoprotein
VAVEPRLVAGTTGTFDVAVDGKVLFSRHREGRFPENDEILRALK